MTHDTPLSRFTTPARTARSDYKLARYRRALLSRGDSLKGILKVPHKDPARARAMRAIFGPQPET